MLSEEAQIGKRVRIRQDHRSVPLRGMVDTIEERWGNPDYIALDVMLDDGGSELFWHHELEEIAERGLAVERTPIEGNGGAVL